MTPADSPGSAQRRWSAACPNCGATVEFASAASASAVCSFCRSSLLREGAVLRKIGLSAELLEDYSPLQLGAGGRFAGDAFTVLGRLQLGGSSGTWNEWHALFDSGKSAWLSEDNGQFVLSFESGLNETPPQSHELVLGDMLVLAGTSWRVSALTRVKTLAAQGELPRPPALGAEAWLAELRNGKDEVGSLDYGAEGGVQWSLGRPVRFEDLALHGLREDKQEAALKARSLECPSCGAALTPQLAQSKSIVCGQCQAVVDISQGQGVDSNADTSAGLAHYAQEVAGREPQIPLGRVGLIGNLALSTGAKLPWQVVGYQERCDLPAAGSDDEQTFWREYLLFNKLEGFAFLVDTEEGWSLVRPLTGSPQGQGERIEWQGQRFRKRWSYAAKVTHVLGEFYWPVARDQIAQVSDYEAAGGQAGTLLSREQTADEVTWSLGRKLDAAEVAKAFKLDASQAGALSRDASSFNTGSQRPMRNIILSLFVLFFIFMLVKSCGTSNDDCQSYKDNFGEASAEYAQCRRSGGPRIYPGGGGYSGGSYGGSGSSGGGHK
ncbi:DUF4178 domain-containing protein [Paucibacter sp. TC2R-5]|uniref:DUF4178 domain-containing protein n=1 Tax=Paucibacter sp. TC2R-5 TaxID=2893555 RepID=UPI0021E48148|nr:DUF4178 domain-containing protein [Paucibacter sp. TC2R-5]MCV2357475.1 DUF4178 domain-containing protein [Paucibacter sp. TC2R-5]